MNEFTSPGSTLSFQESFYNQASYAWGVATGAVVDDDGNSPFHPDCLLDELDRILYHSWIQHPIDDFVEREGPNIGILVFHPEWSDKTNNVNHGHLCIDSWSMARRLVLG